MGRIKLLILLLVVATLLVLTPICTVAGAQTAAGIVYPHNGSNAGPTEPMSGTAQAPQSGQTLRMVLYVPSVGKYYPQETPITVNPDGSWYYRCSIGSGGDNGKQFQINVVAADANANSAFDNYIATGKSTGSYPGMASLPAGATTLTSAMVTRVDSNVQATADPPIPTSSSPSVSPTPTPTPVPTITTTSSTTPATTAASATTSSSSTPGFEAVYAVAGFLAVAYLVVRRRK